MLEIKNLTKIYKPKKGVPVTALNGVSITFPETGMVFLLGKSGCGKSTLLNLLGGLDSYDSGEIIISGKSSKSFKQSDFDSYRNTMVGFIFQEYNVLEEFTVGANIALALELQGKKASDETISDILSRVDLEGYGNRRPNELSGGQKQRVAIARALVKNPKIIMADEPTGALDSATGRQVLETLKKLSREKLVILVSHDREFAEKYGDRIIELSDGRVLSDREFDPEATAFQEEALAFGEGQIRVSAGYRLTEEDRIRINEYLAALEEDREAVILAEKRRGAGRRETVKPDLSHLKPIKFISSRLPMKVAFRIGGSALKHKKIRLVFTILLSCIAFGLFGLADTFGAYNHVKTCTRSILDSQISYAAFVRSEKYFWGAKNDNFDYRQIGKLKEEELDALESKTGVSLQGVFVPVGVSLEFRELYNNEAEFTETNYHIYPYSFNGFAELKEGKLPDHLTLLCGRLPDGEKNEIAISSYVCETFRIGGFARLENGETVYDPVEKNEDMLGKVFPLNGVDYTVVGVLDSGLDLDRYRSLTKERPVENTANMLVDYALMSELYDIREHSYDQIAFVGEGHVEKLIEREPPFLPPENGWLELYWEDHDGRYYGFGADRYGTLKDGGEYEILWVDEELDSLKQDQMIVSSQLALMYLDESGADVDLEALADGVWSAEERETVCKALSELLDMSIRSYCHVVNNDDARASIDLEGVRIVGVLMPDEQDSLSDPGLVMLGNEELIEDRITRSDDGIYQYAVGAMPKDYDEVEKLVRMSSDETDPVRYELQNSVVFELEALHEILTVLSDVFLYIGIGFAIFASALLANFIGTSIAYKKQQIGILRAIGARGGDVFRIFFSESFFIAMINFVFSSLGTFGVVALINYVIRSETGLLVTILHFSARQLVLIFAVSLLVAVIGSFIPVKKIASKKPIDAIRDR